MPDSSMPDTPTAEPAEPIVLHDVADRIATITLNRSQARNLAP